MKSKVTLFLMSFKGYHVLEKLLSEFDPIIIDKIIASKDNYVKNDYFKEIKDLAQSFGIPFFDKNNSYNLSTKYCIAISWKWLIKGPGKLIVLHDSILPRYRGFSPLVNSLINNESSIGVSAILANEEFDRGDIIDQRRIDITYPIKINDAIILIAPLYFDIIKEIINNIINNIQLPSFKQEGEASYSLWRDEDDYNIDWTKDACQIRGFIDALGYPFFGASSHISNKKVRIFEAEEMEDIKIENRTPGKVIFIKHGSPVVVCGKGLIWILSIVDDKSNKDLLPFKKLRTRFK